jgi:hypothetical protein
MIAVMRFLAMERSTPWRAWWDPYQRERPFASRAAGASGSAVAVALAGMSTTTGLGSVSIKEAILSDCT